MVKAEFQNWWRSQTAHPSRYQPTVPICPCAACFNGTGHGQEVFRDPIDPGEVLPLKKEKLRSTTSSVEKPKEKQDGSSKAKSSVKKPWYKQAGGLARKPSTSSMASDLVPLWATSTTRSTRRTSSEGMA
ncbi:hypothetical protein F5Y13DRAFT_53588 [Hypoxylon sp. FL1857]|nr:hypothetical protein F5Y13DRAFT_53588 [Hypoxylon sp. FL1857]